MITNETDFRNYSVLRKHIVLIVAMLQVCLAVLTYFLDGSLWQTLLLNTLLACGMLSIVMLARHTIKGTPANPLLLPLGAMFGLAGTVVVVVLCLNIVALAISGIVALFSLGGVSHFGFWDLYKLMGSKSGWAAILVAPIIANYSLYCEYKNLMRSLWLKLELG